MLRFVVEGASVPPALAPCLALSLKLTGAARGLFLHTQVRIDAPRRRYTDAEAPGLRDLFGERARWPETITSLLWASVATSVAPFEGETTVELTLPCSLDLSLSTTRWFEALEGGVAPLSLYFSGTAFVEAPHGGLMASPIPREAEARFDLPVATWREMMDRHHGGAAFLTLRRDVLDRLQRFRSDVAAPSWERAVEELLARAGARA